MNLSDNIIDAMYDAYMDKYEAEYTAGGTRLDNARAAMRAAFEVAERALRPERYREGTHAADCHTWGPRHYECLMRKFDAVKARVLNVSKLLDPLDDAIDRQIFSEKVSKNFDAPDDYEYVVGIPAKAERDFNRALILLQQVTADE